MYSGTMIDDLIALVGRVERDTATRELIREEMDLTLIIVKSNALPVPSVAATS